MDVLFVNFLAYMLWARYAYKKFGAINIYFILVLMITSIAFLGILTVFNGVYYDTFGVRNTTKLSYEPYILCFIVYFILFFPLRNLHLQLDNRSVGFLFGKKFRLFVVGWTVFYTFYLALLCSEFLQSLVGGLGNAYEARHMEGEVLYQYDSVFISYIVKGYGFFIYSASSPVLLLYAVIGQKISKISKSFAGYIAILCLLPSPLSSISQGSRGALFADMICYSFYASLLWNLFSKPIKRLIIRYAIIVLSLMLVISLIITIQRVGGKDSGSSILRYFGEPFPNLGYNMYGQVRLHPMGLRFFPEVVFGDNPPWDSTDESYRYWEGITGVPVINFKTFFGDLYIEFGSILAVVIPLVMCLAMKLIIRKRLSVLALPIVYYYIQICSQSFAGFNKTGHFSVFQFEIVLIFTFCLYILNMLDSRRVSRKKHKSIHPTIYPNTTSPSSTCPSKVNE